MTRYRVTIRGEGTELRGFATAAALQALAKNRADPFVVIYSVTEDDFNPFVVNPEKEEE